MSADAVTLSVVSHGQNALVAQLLADIAAHCAPGLRIIVKKMKGPKVVLAKVVKHD